MVADRACLDEVWSSLSGDWELLDQIWRFLSGDWGPLVELWDLMAADWDCVSFDDYLGLIPADREPLDVVWKAFSAD